MQKQEQKMKNKQTKKTAQKGVIRNKKKHIGIILIR